MRPMRLSQRRALTGFLFTLPVLLGMLAFFLIPFLISISLSLTSGVGGDFVGLRNYRNLLANGTFQLAAKNTGRFILIAVPLIMAAGLGIALLLHRKLRGSQFFRTVFLFPYVLPVSAAILFFQLVFDNGGILNGILTALHLPVTDWLHSSSAFGVLVFLYIWKNCGYNIVLFLAALNSIPKPCQDAARIDGATPRQVFLHVTLPLMAPYLFFISIISIINSFKVFREAYILCGSYPPSSIYMLQHFMNNNFANANYLHLSSGAILVFFVIFLLVLLLFWLRRKAGDIEA